MEPDIERQHKLGFYPQKEIIYMKHLPYADLVDAESNDILSRIKSALGRSVQMRDLKISTVHWTCQLSKYIRLYGYKFSKEDHVAFVKFYFELVTMPGLDYTMVVCFAQLLNILLKKRKLISRSDLTLPWEPLYQMIKFVSFTKLDDHALVMFPENALQVLKQLVQCARNYFPADCTQEMLNEFRPLLCPFDVTMGRGLYYMELFLPTMLPPQDFNKGFRLWFEEVLGLWLACDNSANWEVHVVSLFCRLSHDVCGYIDWNPYVPQIFSRVLRCLDIPLSSQKVSITRTCSFDVSTVVSWIINIMGGRYSTVQRHLDQVFHALDSYFHPSNIGKWTKKLHTFISKLSLDFCQRLNRERYPKVTWENPVHSDALLMEDDITMFVKSLCPIVLISMFSKIGSNQAANAFQHMSNLRPEIVLPPLLERAYPSLQTLTEPHRLISCLNCIVAGARPMMTAIEFFPEGRKHIIPLLQLALPGIDTNDHMKSLVTFQLISGLLCFVPIVDCSTANSLRSDMTEDELELCSMTAQWEDFILSFLDRLFLLVETSSQDHSGPDGRGKTPLSGQEIMMEGGLVASINSLATQCSLKLFDVVANRVHRFVTTNVFEIHVAGRFAADILRTVVKVHPERTVEKFVPFFCIKILTRCEQGEEISKMEKMDHEFLWSLKMLSELVRCNGNYLVPYKARLLLVLHHTLHFQCPETGDCAGTMLRYLLRTLTLTYCLDYRSSTTNWERSFADQLPIREWGQTGDVDNLNVKWHIPSPNEREFAESILKTVLLEELAKIKTYIQRENLNREELKRVLENINHCVVGAASLLPMWQDETVRLMDSAVELQHITPLATKFDMDIDIDGENVRAMIVETLHSLVAHMLLKSEDDTKSLYIVICLYSVLIMYHGSERTDFDNRWRGLKMVKRALANKFVGGKKHLRSLLIDRVQLLHELRVISRQSGHFTKRHMSIYKNMFLLATSRYSEVRKTAQHVLGSCMYQFAYSFTVIIPDLLPCLRHDPVIQHHQFKGALYLVLGENEKHSLIAKRDWSLMSQVWPAIIEAQHSEKNSILKLMDCIMEKLNKTIETTDITTEVTEKLLEASLCFWTNPTVPLPAEQRCMIADLVKGEEQEKDRNAQNARLYNNLVEDLVYLIYHGNLNWKFYLMAIEMLGFLTRHDIKFPKSAVELFVKNMLHESVKIRRVCLGTVSAIMWTHKRPSVKLLFDPYEVSGATPPASDNDIKPGDRPDNKWHHFDEKNLLNTHEKYESAIIVEKTHWGYYTWPKKMFRYAPPSQQAKLGRDRSEMKPEEHIIYDFFTFPPNVEKLVFYMVQEEEKEVDKFHRHSYIFFKCLFHNYDTAFIDTFKPIVEKLVKDTGCQMEYNQRLAAEIITGMVQGCKHWDFTRVNNMWEWLVPTLQVAITNMSSETIEDWGTAFATMSENRDPRKLHWLFTILLKNPLSGEGGSFGDDARMYCLQGALAQQEWRVPQLLHRISSYLRPYLEHNFKLVRDRVGSFLVNVFMYDLYLPGSTLTTSPRRLPFIQQILPKLEILKTTVSGPPSPCRPGNSPANSSPAVDELPMIEFPIMNGPETVVEEDTERKKAIRLCKTVMQWVQGSITRSAQTISPEVLRLLPLFATVQSEHSDKELKELSTVTLAVMAQCVLPPTVIRSLLEIVQEVSQMRSWRARVATLDFLQVSVFCNLFMLRDAAIVATVQGLVLDMLKDEQIEVCQRAGIILGGLMHCGYITFNKRLLVHFKKLCATPIVKKRVGVSDGPDPQAMINRHAGVLGLCAYVQAYPYDVPDLMPKVLMILSNHLEDPQPIQGTVKHSLSQFKRTHYDNWQDHKQKFTEDQLVVLTDMLISPSYYA